MLNKVPVLSGVEGVPGNFPAAGADEDVSSVRQRGGGAKSAGEAEPRGHSEERSQLDPVHSGRVTEN